MKTRKLICILLSVVLIFGLSNSSLVFASDGATEGEIITDELLPNPDNAFYAPTIRQLIDVNLELGNQDEEFYHTLANAYLASPSLLAETISDLSAEDVQYLAKAIAYDLQKTDRAELAVIPEDCKDEISELIARMIFVEVNNTANASLYNFAPMPIFEEQMLTAEELMLLSDVEIYSVTPAATTSSVGSVFSVNVSFGSGTVSNSVRQYTVKLYKTVGDTTTLVSSKSTSILAGRTGGVMNISVSFAETGIYTFYAEIYTTSGSLLSASTVSSSVTVSGRWRITVVFKEDRDEFGTLCIYNASGALRYSCTCLGRSVSNDPPNVYYGNTPTGECTGELGGPDSNTYSYGPYKYIRLTPISEDYFENRSGILIHGGEPASVDSPFYPYRPTNGCIRVRNFSQERLQTVIERMVNLFYHEEEGDVSITEEP